MNAASRRGRFAGAVVAFVLAALPGTPAGAIPVGPGQFLEIPFAWTSPPVVSGASVDTLTLTLANASTASGLIGITVSLLDGQTLLGQVTTSATERIFAFAEPPSEWTKNADISVDLASVRSGAIAGRLLVTPIFSGSPGSFFDVVLPAFPPVQAGRSPEDTVLFTASPDPVLGTPRVVPEPASAILLAAAVATLSALRPRSS